MIEHTAADFTAHCTPHNSCRMVKLGPMESEEENDSLRSWTSSEPRPKASGCESSKTEREREEKDICSEEEDKWWSDWSETTTPVQNDDEGFRNPWGDHGLQPSSSIKKIENDPWTDFNQQEQKSFSSDNDSGDEDEEINKICFQIKPISATTVSVEELQRAAASLHLQYTWNMVSQQIDLHYN